MERLLTASSVFLVSAHVTTTLLGDPRTYFLLAALATTSVNLLVTLPTGRWSDYVRSGIAYHIVYAIVAWVIDAFVVYCIAYASSLLILVWIDLSHARGVVTYDPTTSYFIVTRGSLYAIIRAVTHTLVREFDHIPMQVELFAPVTLATIETVGMFVYRSTAYTFAVTSYAFVVYALFKTIIFLAVPRLETWILETI